MHRNRAIRRAFNPVGRFREKGERKEERVYGVTEESFYKLTYIPLKNFVK
jgi:hypothetical protein